MTQNNKLPWWRSLALWIVVVPMIVVLLYFGLFAADRYVSDATVVVQQEGNDQAAQIPGIATLLSGVGGASREQTLYLRDYITSPDMMDLLEHELQLREHYAGRWRDPLYFARKDMHREDWLAFYRRVVHANYDDTTGLLTVEVQGFDSQYAQTVLARILTASEAFVNEISHKMARDQLRFAEVEFDNARRLYQEKREVLLDFQTRHKVLDAQAQAESGATIVATLDASLAQERAKLTALQAVLAPDAPQVRAQKEKVASLQAQREAENNKLVSASNTTRLNTVAAQYRNLKIDAGLAEEAYKLGMTALENARIETAKKVSTLVVIQTPYLAETAIYPRRLYDIVTCLAVLLLIYGITRFVLATIADHKD